MTNVPIPQVRNATLAVAEEGNAATCHARTRCRVQEDAKQLVLSRTDESRGQIGSTTDERGINFALTRLANVERTHGRGDLWSHQAGQVSGARLAVMTVVIKVLDPSVHGVQFDAGTHGLLAGCS